MVSVSRDVLAAQVVHDVWDLAVQVRNFERVARCGTRTFEVVRRKTISALAPFPLIRESWGVGKIWRIFEGALHRGRERVFLLGRLLHFDALRQGLRSKD